MRTASEKGRRVWSIRNQFALFHLLSNGILLVGAGLLILFAHWTQVQFVDGRDLDLLKSLPASAGTVLSADGASSRGGVPSAGTVPSSDAVDDTPVIFLTPPMKWMPTLPELRVSNEGAAVGVSLNKEVEEAIRAVKQGLMQGYERIVIGGLLLVFLVNGGLSAWFIRSKMERPLQQAAGDVAELASGNYAIEPHPASTHEIRQLRHHLFLLSQSLKRAEDMARQAEQQRRTLVSGIGHDLATPLTNVQGYAETLLMDLGHDPEAVPLRAYAEIIQRNARQAGLLMKALLQANRPESGFPPGETISVDLCHTLQQLAEDFGQAARRNGQSLQVLCPAGLTLETDETSLKRMLSNVVQNFLQHAGEGTRMTISAGRTEEGVEILLADNGVGVPQQTVSRLTDLMYSGDAARNNRHNSGLGLYIAARLAERLQGEMTLESDTGKGMVVRFLLPG